MGQRGRPRRPVVPAARVRAAFVAHGLGRSVCDALLARAADLVHRTRSTDREHALLLSAEAGHQLGDVLIGERRSIDLGPLIRIMRQDRQYVMVHTHPSDGPFSDRDALLLFVRAEVAGSVVLGVRGTLYVMSLASDRPRPLFDEVVQLLSDRKDALAEAAERAIATGAMTVRAARSEQMHAAWSSVAPRVGLRYTRLQAGSRDDEDHGRDAPKGAADDR